MLRRKEDLKDWQKEILPKEEPVEEVAPEAFEYKEGDDVPEEKPVAKPKKPAAKKRTVKPKG